MAENLSYRVVFLRGSLAGKTRALAAGVNTTAGRSRSCEIRLEEPDVSGRHVLFTVAGRGVSLENLSSRSTRVDGAALAMGESRALPAGAVVELGAGVEFTLECVDGGRLSPAADNHPTAAGDSRPPSTRAGAETFATRFMKPGAAGRDPDATPLPPVQKEAADPGETLAGEPLTNAESGPALTQFDKTRLATPEEIDVLRETHTRRRRMKTGTVAVLGGLALAGATALYLVFTNRPPEQELTLQKNGAGREIRAEEHMDPEMELLCLSFPAARKAAVGRTENSIVVDAWVGRDSDVPLRLELHWDAPPGNAALDMSRAESFEMWCAMRPDLMTGAVLGSLNALPDNGFIGTGHGIPCLRYKYKRDRGDGGDVKNWTGLLAFFRNRDTCYAYLCELPVQEEFRGSRLIQIPERFMVVGEKFTGEHWEGLPPGGQDGRPAAELQAGWRELMEVGKATEWERIERYLVSALIQLWPARAENPEPYQIAMKALAEHRANKQRRAQQLLARRIEAASMRDAKLGAAIDREARDLFGSPEDARHYRVRVENWWEDDAWRE